MKGFPAIFCILVALALAGCSYGQPTAVPTSTATPPRFIRVPTPTGAPPPKPSATLTPTIAISSTLTGTLIAPTLTPTPTPTLTPTPTPATVSQLPDPAGYSWQEVVGGLSLPVGLVSARDNSGRLFIIEQAGLILVYKDGSLLAHPFLDLTQKVNCCAEKGLLGLAFHPKYAENGYFYVDYTEKVGGGLYIVVDRYRISSTNPDQADPTSEQRLLYVEKPGTPPFQNHNGGQLQFGPDGYLYIGMGDGGSEGDPLGNGQSVQTLWGKILRLDVDSGTPYAIPPDNPFAQGGGLPEIWAYGLRNPWRFSFDTLNGDLYISDVGQDAWEEIDWLPAGSPGGTNFGWSYFEGSHPYRGSPPASEQFVMPVAEYSHSYGNSVIGGYVYRGQSLPAWQGVYLYSDNGSGLVWGLLHLADGSWQAAQMFDTGLNVSSFGVDESGEIYIVDYAGRILTLK
jgi:glucose/arabinose dehydrogenase